MQKPSASPPQGSKQQPPEEEKWKTFFKAENTQLSLQIRELNGSRHTWPYNQLTYHILKGGTLTICFSGHTVIVTGRHLEEADDGLRLQSLVYLEENGTRRKDALGEPEIPEDQPSIDWIRIVDLNDE